MKIQVEAKGTVGDGTVIVTIGEMQFEYSWQQLNPYCLIGLLQYLGHEVEWIKKDA